jgi:hypothetical protein
MSFHEVKLRLRRIPECPLDHERWNLPSRTEDLSMPDAVLLKHPTRIGRHAPDSITKVLIEGAAGEYAGCQRSKLPADLQQIKVVVLLDEGEIVAVIEQELLYHQARPYEATSDTFRFERTPILNTGAGSGKV